MLPPSSVPLPSFLAHRSVPSPALIGVRSESTLLLLPAAPPIAVPV